MGRNLIIFFVALLVSLLVGLGVVRWFYPELIGVPVDLQVVQVDKKVPPFFEAVFRANPKNEFFLNDPYLLARPAPLQPEFMGLGPHDLLGFRNKAVPVFADVITIGDSQTYGNNASLSQSWPGSLSSALEDKKAPLYNMSAGSWAAIQYLYVVTKALAFKPRVLVVAYYTGNDSLESFRACYALDYWKHLRPDAELSISDLPAIKFPPPKDQHWPVEFSDGTGTIFTPAHRLAANALDSKVVTAGYEIMSRTAKEIAALAERANTKLIFTIIPSKELVYYRKIKQHVAEIDPVYKSLIKAETQRLKDFKSSLKSLSRGSFVDLLPALQAAILNPKQLYPSDTNGHPLPAGYQVIAETLLPAVKEILPEPKKGLLIFSASGKDFYYLVEGKEYWQFESLAAVRAKGLDPEEAELVELRDLARLSFQSTLKVR